MTIRLKPGINREDVFDLIGTSCLFVFIFLTSYIFLFRYDHTMFIIRYLFLISGAALGYLKCIFIDKPRRIAIPLFALCIVILWGIAFLGQKGYKNYPASDMLYTFCYIGISYFILEGKHSRAITLCLFAFTAVVVLLRLFSDIDSNEILFANSRNYISILLLLSLLLYYINCHDNNKPILVTPVLLFFFISIHATGRGGIIVSGFLTVSLLVYKFIHIKNKKFKILLAFVLLIVLIIILFLLLGAELPINDLLENSFSRFYLMGTSDTGRFDIWRKFFRNNALDVNRFLFGSDTQVTGWYEGNLHNSFFQSYASFGLLGFAIIVISIVLAGINGLKRKDYLWLALFISLLLRAFTDRVFFQGYCEPYLYYFVFYRYFHKKDRTQTGVING